MPNYCNNKLIVKGKPEVVKQFILENFRTNKYPYKENSNEYAYILDFEQFDPTPLNDNGEVFDDWYNWRLCHWGCKWSPLYYQYIKLTVEYEDENKKSKSLFNEVHHLAEEEGLFTEETIKNLETNADIMRLELLCDCETPWGPPEGIFRQWMEKYSESGLEASLKFYEPGCEILGELWFSGDDYSELYIDKQDNSKEHIQYLLEEGWESRDWYIENSTDMILEMHENEEEAKLIANKVEETLISCKTEDAATLIADIYDKYYNWLQGDKDEPSKE